MAFGFPPQYVQDFQLNGMDEEHFLVIALEAAHKLDWSISFVSKSGFIAFTKLSWKSFSYKVTVKIDQGVASLKSETTGSQIVDWGKNKSNIELFLEKFETVRSSMTPNEIETKLEAVRQDYASKADDILIKPPSGTNGLISDLFSIFKPTEGYYITPILINVNLFIFIAMVISGVDFLMPENRDLLNWGANFRPLTLDGQWWRLLTACFLHIGSWHLALNLYALLYIGVLLEPYLGKSRFLAAYLLSGIAASLASLWWHELTISAGASGAIFGMYGVFLALLTTSIIDKIGRDSLLLSIAVFVGFNILYGLNPSSGIDNAAHIGGLLSGLIIGYALVPSLKQFENNTLKFSTIAVLCLTLLISSVAVYASLSNDIVKYDEKMQAFFNMETMALDVFNLPEETSKEKMLSEIRDRGIYYWLENLKLLMSFNELDLPATIKARNSILEEYCQLRIKSYELIYKAINEETDKYDHEIFNYNQKIEAILTQLNEER